MLDDYYNKYRQCISLLTNTDLYTLVLFGLELVRADGSYRNVGFQLLRVLEEKGQRIHAAERGTDHHYRPGV